MTESVLSRNPALRGVIRFLGSLTFLILLLSSMLIALILPTVVNQINPDFGYDRTVGALRRDWYGAWWFNILMGLLMVNLTVCTVIRTPWRYFWMWGFLITHSGILTLMIGAAVTFNTKIYGDLQAVEGASYDYFTIEGENEILVATSDGAREAFPFEANPYRRSTTHKTFKLKDSPTYIHVDEFLPHVVYETTYREAPEGRLMVAEVALHGPDGNPRRLSLRAGSEVEEEPLTLLAMPMKASQFERFSGPTGEDGLLTLTIGGEMREIDVLKNKDQAVRVGDAEITVREWGLPGKDVGDYWVNFDLARPGKDVERWQVLAFDFEHPFHRIGDAHDSDPGLTGTYSPRLKPGQIHGPRTLGALYICKLETGFRYLIIGSKGDKAQGTLERGQRIRYPFMPLPLEIEFVRWMDKAEESAEPAEPRKDERRIPALRMTVESGPHRDTRWVKFLADGATFSLGERALRVFFQGRQFRDLPFTLTLDDFRVAFNRGTMQSPKHFESDLTLQDHDTGEVAKKTIEVNTPMKYKGFVIYQASWNPRNRQMSIFQISKDPGKKILYLGWVMAVSGSIFMFFLKPFLQKLIKSGSKSADAPLASVPALALFALVTLGTVAGLLAPLFFPGVDALWLGLAVAGADLVLALLVALVARAWRAAKPVRALQAGEILAAGWCLNTAALVILLMMKVTA